MLSRLIATARRAGIAGRILPPRVKATFQGCVPTDLISFRLRLFRALPPVIGIVDGVSRIHLRGHALRQGVDNYQARLRSFETFWIHQPLEIAWPPGGTTQGH